MRFTLNIPCLWQLGFIPRFDGYACQVALPLFVFLAVCGVITLTLHRQNARQTDEVLAHIQLATTGLSDTRPDPADSELHYGVIIDCGSSGSRVFVHFWPPHSGQVDVLLKIEQLRDVSGQPYIKKIEPGISAFVDRPSEAAEYLRPLLDYAKDAIPHSKYSETPLYIMATAGMRVLTDSEQELILDDLVLDIPLWYKFVFSKTHLEVISGKQEAIYAWISINYSLGRFHHTTDNTAVDDMTLVELPGPEPTTHIRKQTVGILDMGGASVQVAYEVPHLDNHMKGLISEFGLGCTKDDVEHVYRVYVATFNNFGSNTARRTYEQNYFANFTSLNTSSGSPVFLDPCLPLGFRQQLLLPGQDMMILQGSGNFHECKSNLRPLLNMSTPCVREPCIMNGVYQPQMDFEHSRFYGFSEFFYTMEDLLQIGGTYSSRKFQVLAKEYCQRNWSQLEEWQQTNRYPRADGNRYRLQCFKSAWMSLVLHDGFKFPLNYRHLTSLQYIQGQEIHWTLGALLYKTKYYPLRELEKQDVHKTKSPWLLMQYDEGNYLVLGCLMVVMAAILVYMRRLRLWRAESLRRVSSRSFFSSEDHQTIDSLS